MKHVNVLIVDDDMFTCTFIKEQLLKLGYYCSTAHTGKECYSRVHDFDIVLLDYYLEHENGIDVLLEIKKMNPSLPIIMLSSQEYVSVAIKSIKYGAFDYVEKSLLNFEKLNALLIKASSQSNSDKTHWIH